MGGMLRLVRSGRCLENSDQTRAEMLRVSTLASLLKVMVVPRTLKPSSMGVCLTIMESTLKDGSSLQGTVEQQVSSEGGAKNPNMPKIWCHAFVIASSSARGPTTYKNIDNITNIKNV